MTRDSTAETSYAAHDAVELARQRVRDRDAYIDETTAPGRRFLFRLGRVPIELSLIEFRIIDFLSQQPYKAFTPRQIVEATHSARCPLTEGSLDEHIRTLRKKLGIFSDYVQSVPYIGYRFKP